MGVCKQCHNVCVCTAMGLVGDSCPFTGRYLTSVDQAGCYTEVRSGCSKAQKHSLEVVSSCKSQPCERAELYKGVPWHSLHMHLHLSSCQSLVLLIEHAYVYYLLRKEHPEDLWYIICSTFFSIIVFPLTYELPAVATLHWWLCWGVCVCDQWLGWSVSHGGEKATGSMSSHRPWRMKDTLQTALWVHVHASAILPPQKQQNVMIINNVLNITIVKDSVISVCVCLVSEHSPPWSDVHPLCPWPPV